MLRLSTQFLWFLSLRERLYLYLVFFFFNKKSRTTLLTDYKSSIVIPIEGFPDTSVHTYQLGSPNCRQIGE